MAALKSAWGAFMGSKRREDRATVRMACVALRIAGCVLSVAAGEADAGLGPEMRRTEVREDCTDHDPLRRPYFGDLHVHTSYSFDSYINGNHLNGPLDAFEFARGEEKQVPAGAGLRDLQLRRPLDFAAVTDHSEYFGETRICKNPQLPGYNSDHCRVFRGEDAAPGGLSAFSYWGLNLTFTDLGEIDTCNVPGSCEASAASVWLDIQQAAESTYDRTSACTFTSFVAYEYTGSSGGFTGHRNVIFRNANVPLVPTSAFETGGTNPPALWSALRNTCIDGVEGCEVLAIPHNSNISGGTMFTEPSGVVEARQRAFYEPLVEVSQIKGASECRFDRLANAGAGTEDELCAWENRPPQTQAEVPGGPPLEVPIDEYPLSNMVRNALKSGLEIEQRIGANPFRFGLVGGTDTHNGTPGAVEEDELAGTHGTEDDTPKEKISGKHLYENPGALAVLWSVENSRDGLFEAMRRRETYATSGTRPVVRFFGGWSYGPNLCNRERRIARGYGRGVPMGSRLRRRQEDRSPRFFALATKDPGLEGHPGTDLQRIQVVKGWVDADGATHEQVYDVAGSANNGAGVDPDDCEVTGEGATELCTVWEDPDFDPAKPAFYYARVLENPTCRWSTLLCKGLGVDPMAADCKDQALAKAAIDPDTEWVNCCANETSNAFVAPITQERAWTSPIWYRPGPVVATQAP